MLFGNYVRFGLWHGSVVWKMIQTRRWLTCLFGLCYEMCGVPQHNMFECSLPNGTRDDVTTPVDLSEADQYHAGHEELATRGILTVISSACEFRGRICIRVCNASRRRVNGSAEGDLAGAGMGAAKMKLKKMSCYVDPDVYCKMARTVWSPRTTHDGLHDTLVGRTFRTNVMALHGQHRKVGAVHDGLHGHHAPCTVHAILHGHLARSMVTLHCT